MLMSVGKSAPIGERLTRRKARSAVPGELQLKEVLLTESCLQRCGTVQEISCCAQVADWPPATAAACSDVGCGGWASSPAVELDDDEPDRPDGASGDVLATLLALRLSQ